MHYIKTKLLEEKKIISHDLMEQREMVTATVLNLQHNWFYGQKTAFRFLSSYMFISFATCSQVKINWKKEKKKAFCVC